MSRQTQSGLSHLIRHTACHVVPAELTRVTKRIEGARRGNLSSVIHTHHNIDTPSPASMVGKYDYSDSEDDQTPGAAPVDVVDRETGDQLEDELPVDVKPAVEAPAPSSAPHPNPSIRIKVSVCVAGTITCPQCFFY
jgi:hypothetical protein